LRIALAVSESALHRHTQYNFNIIFHPNYTIINRCNKHGGNVIFRQFTNTFSFLTGTDYCSSPSAHKLQQHSSTTHHQISQVSLQISQAEAASPKFPCFTQLSLQQQQHHTTFIWCTTWVCAADAAARAVELLLETAATAVELLASFATITVSHG